MKINLADSWTEYPEGDADTGPLLIQCVPQSGRPGGPGLVVCGQKEQTHLGSLGCLFPLPRNALKLTTQTSTDSTAHEQCFVFTTALVSVSRLWHVSFGGVGVREDFLESTGHFRRIHVQIRNFHMCCILRLVHRQILLRPVLQSPVDFLRQMHFLLISLILLQGTVWWIDTCKDSPGVQGSLG